MTSLQILGGRVDCVDFASALCTIESFVESGKPHQVVTANTLMLLAAENDPALRVVLDDCDLSVPESWGIAWASRVLKSPLAQFVPGIDLMLALCQWAAVNGKSVFLLGGKPGVADRAAEQLQKKYPTLRIAGVVHGYFTPERERTLLTEIASVSPTFLFVGMNMPRQEKWIARNLRALNVPVAMGVGGSFDVVSGQLRRAPAWMRRLGIEWIYRTLQEPWRIGRIRQLPVFMWRVWRTLPR